MAVIGKILTFIFVTLFCAGIGAVVAFFGIFIIATAMGDSNMNGGLAMGAAGLAPIGAIIGAGVGIWLSWLICKNPNPKLAMGLGYGLLGIVALCVGGWFLVEELTDGNPYEPGKEPVAHIEWKVPDQVPITHVDSIFRQMMRSSHMDWILSDRWDEPRSRDEDGRTIIRMTVELRWRVRERPFQLWRAPNHDDRITVDLGIPADPEHSDEYGPWTKVEGHPGNEFRWRIERRD